MKLTNSSVIILLFHGWLVGAGAMLTLFLPAADHTIFAKMLLFSALGLFTIFIFFSMYKLTVGKKKI